MKASFLVLTLALFSLFGCKESPTVDAGSTAEAAASTTTTPSGDDPALPPPTYDRPKDPRSLDVIRAGACVGVVDSAHPDGWRCKSKKPVTFAATAPGQTPITPFTWTVGDWWIDPSNVTATASDQNDCVTSSTACLTFGEVIQHRLGTFSPRLQQITKFHKMSAQPAGQDPIFFTPFVAMGGQAQFIDTLVLLDGGADVTVGTVTPKQQDAGQLLQVEGLGSAAAVGVFVCDVSRGNSCAFIDSMVDAGVAIMQQPLTDASFNMPVTGLPAPAEVNSWTTGDTVNLFTENATNLKSWNPVGGDVSDSGAGTFSGGWVQFTHIVDLSGQATPASALPLVGQGINGIAGSLIGPRLYASSVYGRGSSAYAIGNSVLGTDVTQVSFTQHFGGGYANGITINVGATSIVAGDAIVHSTMSVFGLLLTPNFYSTTSVTVAPMGQINTQAASNVLWGPGTLTLQSGSIFRNVSPGWGTFFMTGALALDTATTGCFVSGIDAGAITCNVPLTQPNLVANHTLKSLNTGATFTDGTGNNSD